MAEINNAYRLICTAPLKYHRVSKASDPTTPWADGELDAALRRAQVNQQFDRWMNIALIVVAVVIIPLVSRSVLLRSAGTGPLAAPLMLVVTTAMSLVSMFVIYSMAGSGSGGRRALYMFWLALAVLRMLRWHV